MKVLYHTSNPKFREKIKQEGLKPQVGDEYFLHWEGEFFNDKKVTSKDDLIPYLFLSEKPYDSGYDDDVWEVNINNASLQKDPANIEGAYVTTEKIPSENLSLIYEGTGESL